MDSTSVFSDILGQAFSRGIQDAVVRELGLQPSTDQPLERRLILQAIVMAEASQQALNGVDFMTRMMFSAAAHTAGFLHACRALELPPDALGASQRAAIDARMQHRFSQAARQRQSPVAPRLAQRWLLAELMAVHPQMTQAF